MYKDMQNHQAVAAAPEQMRTSAPPAAGTRPGAGWAGPERRSRHAASTDWPLQLLDEIDYGIVVVDPFLRVVYANHAARCQLKAMPQLRQERGMLLPEDPADTDRLAAAVRAAATQRLRRLLVLGRGAQRCSVSVVPVPVGAAGAGVPGAAAPRGPAQVLVMLPRSQLCEPLSIHGYARDHGLSSAESQVLVWLCKGEQPSDIARLQGVAISTVRTQIASLRQKTGAATVADLVQHIARLPPICSALQPEARADLGAGLAA
ncbi:MAG: helix-turn-helix domain-containing protein [Pseudomonadota bacterium]